MQLRQRAVTPLLREGIWCPRMHLIDRLELAGDEAVATVDSTGLVISAGKGEARITASFGGKSAEVPVVVDQLPATVEIVGSSPIFFLV